MKQYELIATTTFGLEAVCKRELISLGFEVTSTDNGKITYLSDAAGIAKSNLWLRSADRVLIKVGEFKATTFDQLFDQTIALPWHEIIPLHGKFDVNGKSVKSKLFSISDSQRIVKKAIAKKLEKQYHVSWLPEDDGEYTVLVSLLNDIATLTIDTSGVALHKRGYRINTVDAPLKETLAAALILLSYYNKDRVLYDVFCGSGTIPIEAAMIAKNIAPGLNRDFSSKYWPIIGETIWKEETKNAYLAIDVDSELKIFASDINEQNLEAAKENAEEAGVDDAIVFTLSDFNELELQDDYSILITNPPYGERLMTEDEVLVLYTNIREKFAPLNTWSKYILTSYTDFVPTYRKKPDRQRKLFNGNIPTWYYQYYGPRPPL